MSIGFSEDSQMAELARVWDAHPEWHPKTLADYKQTWLVERWRPDPAVEAAVDRIRERTARFLREMTQDAIFRPHRPIR